MTEDLNQIDQEVENLLTQYMGNDAKIAFETYRLGSRMRAAIAQEVQEKSSMGVSKCKLVLESEAFHRALLLVVVPLLGAVLKSPAVTKQLRRLVH